MSIPLPRQDPIEWDFSIQEHNLDAIEQSPTPSLPVPALCNNPEKKPCKDEWTASLQQNTAIVRSKGAYRKSIATDAASVNSPCPTPPSNHDPWATVILPAADCEDKFNRVPSPLLYHKVSKGTSSKAVGLQSPDFTPPSQRIDKYNRARFVPPTEFHDSFQQVESSPVDESVSQRFIAARLPLMGHALSCDEFRVKNTLVNTNTSTKLSDDCTLSTVAYTMPIMTTTNTYLFPKRVFNTDWQPDAAWSAPSYTDTPSPWKSSRNLMFPKLSIPGHRASSKSSPILSDTDSGDTRIRHHQVPLVKRNSLWLKTSLPAPLPQMFDSRCRSSTQDSFDSKFSVSTATKQIEPPNVRSVSIPQPLNSVHSAHDAVPEEPSANAEDNSWTGTTTECPPDLCDVQFADVLAEREGIAASFQERSGEGSNKDEEHIDLDMNSRDGKSTEQSQDVWFNYLVLRDPVDYDAGSEVGVDVNDVEVNADSWIWDDQDDWETITSTPATEADGHLDFGEDVWAW